MALPLRKIGESHQYATQLQNAPIERVFDAFASYKLGLHKWSRKTEHTSRLALFHWSRVDDFINLPIKNVTRDDIERVMIEIASTCRGRWANRCLGTLRTMFQWALKKGVIDRDPTVVIEKLEEEPKDRVCEDFSREEIALLCETVNYPAIAKFTWTACYTGLRLRNLMGPDALIWEWIAPNWMIHIPRERVKQARALAKEERKTFDFPIHPKLQEILLPRREPLSLVLDGLPSITKVKKALKIAAKKIGINPAKVFPHNFRRTTCRWLKEAGVTREQARELMGWHDDEVMLNDYWPKTTDKERWDIIGKL